MGGSDLGATGHPPVATEQEIAMTYWQLAHTPPKFDQMAAQTDQFKNSSQFEKDQVKAAVITDLKNSYDNITFNHPTIFAMKVHLSPYSEKNKGFVIKDFEDQTYFKYSFAGDKYAVVPRGLMDHQFLGPMNDDTMLGKINYYQKHGGNTFVLMIYLKPDYADPPGTLTEIDGDKYHIISGTVAHVGLYDPSETQQLWGDNSVEFNKAEKNDLLQLKQ